MFQPITEGLWHATHDLTMPGGIQFRARSTVVRLTDGSLWMHSPIPIDDAGAAQLAKLGEVRHIIAPNGWHDRYAGEAKARFPEATLWASGALRASKEHLPADAWLGESTPPWADELRPLLIEGAPKADEWVFLHEATRSVIVTDLLFQIRYPVNAVTKLVLWMAGAGGGKLAQSRLWRSVTKDRDAAGRSVGEMLEWEFERVILAHGDLVEGPDARERAREALWWMRAAA